MIKIKEKNPMKSKSLLVILIAVIYCSATYGFGAIKITDDFSFYGFIKLDGIYQDAAMNCSIAPRYAKPGDGEIAITATTSRFGFKWQGPEVCGNWKIKGQLEFDVFDVNSPNQMKFRTRHANFSLYKGKSKFLLGQFWDVFAPNLPSTLMTIGCLWQVGNTGFWRAQLRYTYNSDNFVLALSLSDPTSAGARKTGFPMLQSRLGIKLGENGKIKIGASGVYGKENNASELGFDSDVNMMGMALDWTIPVSKFLIKGEFTIGENLKNFVSRANVCCDPELLKFTGKKTNAFWAELIYKTKIMNAWAGYSFEIFTDENQLALNELKDTQVMFAGVKFILGKGISCGLEYARFTSKYFQGSEDSNTNQVILSCIYSY